MSQQENQNQPSNVVDGVGAGSTALVKKLSYQDAKLLDRAVQLEESDPPFALAGSARAFGALVLVFVIWASFTPFTEKATAPGLILPQGRVQPVQSVDRGRVSEIYVLDGETVDAGTPILKLESDRLDSELSELQNRLWSIQLERERLLAELDGRSMDAKGTGAPSALVVAAEQALASRQAQLAATDDLYDLQRTVADEARAGLAREVDALEKRRAALQESVNLRQQLVDMGNGSRIQLLDSRQRLSEVEADLAARRNGLVAAIARYRELEKTYASARADEIQLARTRVSDLEGEIAQTRSAIGSLQAQVQTTVIVAPSQGVLSGLDMNTPGKVIEAGELLASIVPEDQALLAEVRVSPRDIGHIQPEQDVLVRVDGYRFGRVGGISGRVERVAADSTVDVDGNRYFSAWVQLEKNYVGENPEANRVLAGMSVSADIETGRKSLMAYLLKPVQDTLYDAFSER